MEAVLWIALALSLVALGGTVTWLIGTRVPAPVFERVQRHGRFAGLEPRPPRRPRGGKRVRQYRLVPAGTPGWAALAAQTVPVRA